MSDRPARGLGARWLGVLLLAFVALGALVAASAGATQSGPPVIESFSGTEANGQVEVGGKIDPNGLETIYDIKVECGAAERSATCEPLPNAPETGGRLAAGHEGEEVRLDVTSLPRGFYRFEVVATNLAGKLTRIEQLEIPVGLPLPEKKFNPYERPNAEGAEWDARSAELSIAESRAKEKAEEEQRVAQEAAERAAHAAPVAPVCVVPSLVGHTLAGARLLLARADCKLGHVTYPRVRHGRLRIAKQSPTHGSRLPADTTIAVHLTRCVSCST